MEIEWKKLFYVAVVNFGIAPSEFWQMTMPEFLALVEDEDEITSEVAEIKAFLRACKK